MIIVASLWLAISSCRTERSYPDKVFLTKVKLKVDNDTLYYWDLEDLIRQQDNRRILVVFRFHTGIYNLGHKMKDRTEKRTKKWEKKVSRKKKKDPLYKENLEKKARKINGGLRNWLMNTVGETPVYLDTNKTNISSNQMLKYCHANGYFDAKVTDSTDVDEDNSKAKVFYSIESGISYRINKIEYVSSDRGLLNQVNNKKKESLLNEGMVYNEELLDDERIRINDLLKKVGYYHFSKAYIRYEVDSTIGNHLMDIKLIINRPSYSIKNGKKDSLSFYNHKRFMVRRIYVYPDFDINNKETVVRDTTIFIKQRNYGETDTIYFVHRFPMKIKTKIISRKIFIKNNQYFNIVDAQKTQNELGNLNGFKYINVRFQPDPIKDYNAAIEYMDAHIELSRLPVNSTSFEIEGTNSSNNLGTAGNWIFKNRNLFHGAEIFDFNVSGGLELQKSIFEDNGNENVINALPFNSLEFATELKLTIPAFLLPVNQNSFSQNSRPVTRFSAGFSYQLRPDYERYISHFKLSYQWKESMYRSWELYFPMNLVRINPDSAFSERIEQFSRTIRYSYEDHFIPGIGTLIQFNNQGDPEKRNYSFRTTRVELAGLSLWAGNGFNNANDSVNGAIYKVLGINYAQYAKFDFDWRYYFRFNDEKTLAYRTSIGLGLPYGNSVILPFEKSYSAGGSNEIRAWKYRSLGPGNYIDDGLYDKTGDISLVTNLEYRFPIISWFKGALFVDAGNVWLLYANDDFEGGEFQPDLFLKQIAVGAGFGLRLDFDFFIFRLDGAFPLRDPALPSGERWVGFGNMFSHINLNFGIGYPF